MGWTRHSGAVVSLAVAATLVANYAIHIHFENRFRQFATAIENEPTDALLLDIGSLPNVSDSPREFPSMPEPPGLMRISSEIQHAVQTVEAKESPPATSRESGPGPVPVPNDAVPIQQGASRVAEHSSPRDDAVRDVIEDELSGSPREERDIWFEELKSLPAGVVRDLLQVRKQLRALPKVAQRPEAIPERRVTEIPAEHASQTRRATAPDWMPTLSAFEQAVVIARHNLANSATPGFKRFRVMIVDNYGIHWSQDREHPEEPPSQAPVEGSRLAPVILDLEQGTLSQTERPLDLAIDGEGFFVALQNDRTVYTRCGAMLLDSQRRICLVAGETSAVLQPVITIPADSREIQVSADGQVSVLRKLGAEAEQVGQLQLARFACPARLRPIGGTMLVPTTGSGAAEVDSPNEGGRGVIQQSCLELSNADPDRELSELSQWQSLLKSLPSVSRPVTARGDDSTSR